MALLQRLRDYIKSKNLFQVQPNLRRTLLAAFLFVTIILFLCSSIAVYFVNLSITYTQIQNKLQSVGTLKEQAIINWLEQADDQLEVLVLKEVIVDATEALKKDPRNAHKMFRENVLNPHTDFFNHFFFIDEDDQVLLNTTTYEEALYFYDVYQNQRNLYQLQQDVFIAPLFYYQEGQRPVLLVSIFITELNGLLIGEINLEPLREILDQPTDLESYVVTEANTVLNKTFENEIPEPTIDPTDDENTPNLQAPPITQGFSGISSSTLYKNHLNQDVIGHYRLIDDLQIVLVVEENRDKANQTNNTALVVLVAILMVVIIIDIFASLKITQLITEPIKRITLQAQDIAESNRYHVIDIKRNDEIGTLVSAFNLMVDRLQVVINTLEVRVKRRTQALETSALVGRRITDILNMDVLLYEVTHLIKSSYDYYHVQVLLLNNDGYLVTRADSEASPEEMVSKKYQFKPGQKSLIGYAGLGEQQVVNNVLMSPIWLHSDDLPHTQSEAAIPLKYGDKTFGVLDVHSDRTNTFLQQDLYMLQSIADQLAIAVRNVRLFRESEIARQQAEQLLLDLEKTTADLTHQGAQLQTAIEVSKAANSILDTPTLMQDAVNLIKKQFNLYYVGLFTIDEDKEWAILKAGTGEAGKAQLENKHKLRIVDSSMIGWSINHREPRISGEVTQDKVRFVNPYLPDTQSEMALPLVSREEVAGALTVQSTKQNAFSEQDIIVLQAVADQLATALQNSQLFSETQAIQARFQDLYHRAPAGYHTLNHEGLILEINDTELDMLGYQGQRDEIVKQKHIADFMTPTSKLAFEEALTTIITSQTPIQNLEITYVCQDSSTITVTTNAAPTFNETGQLKEIYASVQDISQQKENEAERESLFQKTEILYNLSQQLISASNRSEIYQVCINALKTVNPTRGISIFIYHHQSQKLTLELVAQWDNPAREWPSGKMGDRVDVTEMGIADLFLSGETIISNQAREDFPETFHKLLNHYQINSMIGTPIWAGGKVIGSVFVGNHEATSFGQENIRLFEGITRQMSVSLENYNNLEEALRRATQLEAAAKVSKDATSELDLSILLPKVVNLIQDAFGYYHTAVFLVDDYQQYAIYQAGTGKVGQRLLQERYKLPINNNSQVGAVIRNGETKVTFDISQRTTFLDHPFLPDTRSELTLPLVVQNEVIGALDIQSARLGDFQGSEEVVLQTIADQLANAIYVARLFEQQKVAAQEIQELHKRYLEEEWTGYLEYGSRYEQTAFTTGLHLTDEQAETTTITNWLADISTQIQEFKTPITYNLDLESPTEEGNGHKPQSVLINPIVLRDTPIGALGLVDGPDREWSEDDLAIIEEVAAQAALAIENARLIEETQSWVQLLKTSASISQIVTATLDLNLLITNGVNLIQSRFSFNTVQLYLLIVESDPQQTLVYSNSTDLLENDIIKPKRVALTKLPLVEQTLLNKQTLVIQQNMPDLSHLMPTKPSDIKSVLLAPLGVRKNVIGVIEIFSNQNNAFNQDVVAVLEILITQLASSIGNAQAYQEQQEIAEKLREVDRLKTQFLANMSHELRTPLNSIIGFSKVILKGIDGPLTDLQQTDLTSIHQSGQHLLGLINNILDLAKIDAGKFELDLGQVNTKILVQGTVSTSLGLVKDKSVQILHNIPDNLPIIEGDETRLRQILLNLVSNAAKFTEEGNITISAKSDKRSVSISVTDSGIGMKEEDLPNIFREFTQVDASTTRRAGGTGLGLPITKRFVELHHGRIEVKSQLGRGTTFTVILPITQSQPLESASKEVTPVESNESDEGTPGLTSERNILVIDGDPRVVRYYRKYLQNADFGLVNLHKGVVAIEKAREVQPFAILLDVLLPDIDGWEVLRELKETPDTQHIPVIIGSIVEDKIKAARLGAVSYLVKPIIQSDLLRALKDLENQAHHTKKILIIDDQADDHMLVKRILRSEKYEIIDANTGLEGLEIIYTTPPDLVILDLSMPGLDGFGVLESLKSNPKTDYIPVIVVTAQDLSKEQLETLKEKANTYLLKGKFTDDELRTTIAELLLA